MRKKVKSEPIDGFVYEVHQLPASEAEEIGAELVAMAAPMLGSLFGEGTGSLSVKSLGDFDLKTLGIKAAVDVFAEKLSSKRLREIRATMAGSTAIYGDGYGDAGAPLAKNYDDHFAGELDAMLEWFAFALEVNFGGFFGGLWERMEKRFPVLQVLQEAMSDLQNTSVGESGNSSSNE